MEPNLDEASHRLYAAANYYSTAYTEEDFKEDFNLLRSVKKALTKPERLDEQRCRLLINNIIILYNVFGPAATRLLFFKVPEWPRLKTVLWFLDRMPDRIEGIRGKDILAKDIPMDYTFLQRLRDCV